MLGRLKQLLGRQDRENVDTKPEGNGNRNKIQGVNWAEVLKCASAFLGVLKEIIHLFM